MEIIKKDNKYGKVCLNEEEIAALKKVVDLFDDIFWACDKDFVLMCNGKHLFTEHEVSVTMLKLFRMSGHTVKVMEGEQE